MSQNQQWFEMTNLRKRKLDKTVWISLRSEKSIKGSIQYGYEGYNEEFLGAGSLMIPLSKKDSSEKLGWWDIGIRQIHSSYSRGDEYITSDIYNGESGVGINLVLNQSFDNNYDSNEWHLHQDLVISLGLKREEDVWVCPMKGYMEVAKLERDEEGRPILLQIKNQFLKDYLCARKSGLYVSAYYSREKNFKDSSILSWNAKEKKETKGKDTWECRILEIHEGGSLFGQKIHISRVGRTDIDSDEDIPDISNFPTNENINSEIIEKSFEGKKLHKIISELWKYDWISPSKTSSIVLGEEQLIDVYFIVDVDGKKEKAKKIQKGGRWLWFKPELVNALLLKRGSFLNWYTQNTGSVACSPNCGVHFGVNSLGFITVYAKDISYLPVWQQQIWAGFNISPEGGISKELHMSQVKSEPASTLAPEDFLEEVIVNLNQQSLKNLGVCFFREHKSIKTIISTIHRFRAIDDFGIYSLAKDVARIIIDDIDIESLQKVVKPEKGKKLGSLKTIENLLSLKIPQESARKILSPLVGIYELRHGDAHLPSRDIEQSFDLINVDRSLPFVIQGHQLLFACVDHLHKILWVVERWNNLKE